MRASDATLDLIRRYYSLMDDGRLEECETLFTPDARLKIAHYPEIVGREAILRVMSNGLANPKVKRLVHDVKGAWDEEDGVAIFEVDATYDMADGRAIVVPGVVIAEIEDGRFRSQRVAADLSPVLS